MSKEEDRENGEHISHGTRTNVLSGTSSETQQEIVDSIASGSGTLAISSAADATELSENLVLDSDLRLCTDLLIEIRYDINCHVSIRRTGDNVDYSGFWKSIDDSVRREIVRSLIIRQDITFPHPFGTSRVHGAGYEASVCHILDTARHSGILAYPQDDIASFYQEGQPIKVAETYTDRLQMSGQLIDLVLELASGQDRWQRVRLASGWQGVPFPDRDSLRALLDDSVALPSGKRVFNYSGDLALISRLQHRLGCYPTLYRPVGDDRFFLSEDLVGFLANEESR